MRDVFIIDKNEKRILFYEEVLKKEGSISYFTISSFSESIGFLKDLKSKILIIENETLNEAYSNPDFEEWMKLLSELEVKIICLGPLGNLEETGLPFTSSIPKPVSPEGILMAIKKEL